MCEIMEIYLPFFVAACHHTFWAYPQMMMLSHTQLRADNDEMG